MQQVDECRQTFNLSIFLMPKLTLDRNISRDCRYHRRFYTKYTSGVIIYVLYEITNTGMHYIEEIWTTF